MSLQSLLNPTPPTPSAARNAPPAPFRQQTWLVVGASRGIGLEFCTQLLAAGHRVIGTARAPRGSSQLWTLTGTPNGKNLTILECDVTDEASVDRFVEAVRKFGMLKTGMAGGLEVIDVVVVNAGVLLYPNRVMEISYKDWAYHLTSNTIGPLMVAQRLLRLSSQLPIHTLVFMSSDSGSTTNFRAFEDGFAAYAASKAALNQGLRHLAAELHRASNASPTPPPYSLPQPSPSYTSFQPPANQFATPNPSFPFPNHHRSSSNHSFTGPYNASSSTFHQGPQSPLHPNPYAQTQPQSPFHSPSSTSPTPPALSFRPFPTTILALHPGEVSTDMANVALGWEVEGIISPTESVGNMLRVIDEKGYGGADDSGSRSGRGRKGEASFWTWEGRPYPW